MVRPAHHKCLQHTNQKSVRELGLTASFQDRRPQPASAPLEPAAARGENASPSNLRHFSSRFSSGEEIKLIISVSKKIAKHAVVRNKIKRRVRTIFRSLTPGLKRGTYLVIAKHGAEEIRGKELENELRSVMII